MRTCQEKTPGKQAEPAEVTAGTSTNVEAVKQRMANVENHIQSVKNVEGKKRNVEDAKQCGENPEDTILGVENERQSECIVQEEGKKLLSLRENRVMKPVASKPRNQRLVESRMSRQSYCLIKKRRSR